MQIFDFDILPRLKFELFLGGEWESTFQRLHLQARKKRQCICMMGEV